MWLRDHCRCAECYHPKTKQRQVDTFAIAHDITPHSLEATTEGLVVEWPPLRTEQRREGEEAQEVGERRYHSSLYPWSWLYANSYAPSLSLSRVADERGQADVVLWGKGITQQPPTVSWKEIMSEDDERGVGYGGFGCIRHGRHPRLLRQFQARFGAACPDGDAPGESAGVGGDEKKTCAAA